MSDNKACEDGYHDGYEDGKYVASVKDLMQIDQLEAENDKLRELVRKLLYGYDHDLPPADALAWWNGVSTQLRELGIEED